MFNSKKIKELAVKIESLERALTCADDHQALKSCIANGHSEVVQSSNKSITVRVKCSVCGYERDRKGTKEELKACEILQKHQPVMGFNMTYYPNVNQWADKYCYTTKVTI